MVRIVSGRIVPHALMAVLLIALILLNWQWDALSQWIVVTQKQFHGLLSQHIRAVSQSPDSFGWMLLLFSFLYGVFHAAGPGHGKAVVVTYLATQKESMKRGVLISLSAAMLQSFVAIALIVVLVQWFSFQFREARSVGVQVELASYALVALVGFWLALKTLWPVLTKRFRSNSLITLPVVHGEGSHLPSPLHIHGHQHTHSHDHLQGHDDHCCQHHYAPEADLNWKQTLAVVFSMGLRPCSGALLVLIYAQIVDVFFVGILATLAIGLGTGITVSLIAVVSVYARDWIAKFVDANEPINHSPRLNYGFWVRIIGGGALVYMGWSLFSLTYSGIVDHPLL